MIQRVTKTPGLLQVVLESGETRGISSFHGELLGWDRETYAVTVGSRAIVYDGHGNQQSDMMIHSSWSEVRWDGRYFSYVLDRKYQYVCEPNGRIVQGPVQVA
jgi:hypothetical protein